MVPDVDAAEALLAYAQSAEGKWPLPQEEPILKAVNTWVALREGDKDALKRVAGWTDPRRDYRVDPLGERIADAWAHYLFGQDPRWSPANEADVANLEELLEANDIASELERAAGLCVSEGEIWPRIYVDANVAPHPLLEWVSRRDVLPMWVGPRLAAAAVVTELPKPSSASKGTVYRHFEVHADGIVLNALFVGTVDRIGELVPLEDHPATAALEEQWLHGLAGMLVDRIPNRIRGTRAIGVSDYRGILDYLLDLNETAAIGAHNVRLTARKRAVISSTALSGAADRRDDLELTPEEDVTNTSATTRAPRARFDSSEEVFVDDPLNEELGRDSKDPFRIMEYEFDAEALIAWKKDLVESALTRVGMNAQYGGISSASDGYAISGTALRLRLIPTDAAGRAKARYWVKRFPRVVAAMQQLDAASPDVRGFNREWTDAVTPPVLDRRPGLPEDEMEEAERHSRLYGAGLESLYQGVKSLHPDWDEQAITDEVDRIKADRPPPTAGGLFGGG